MHLSLSSTELTLLACAPLLMVVVSVAERRWGPAIAGIVAAAPFTALIGLLLVYSDLGASIGDEMAFRMAGYLPAQVGIAVVIIALVGRTAFVPTLLAGLVAYGALAAAAAQLPHLIAVIVSLVVLLVSQKFVKAPASSSADRVTVAAGPGMLALRAGAALITALGLLLVADQFGPAAGGAIGAFPIFTITLSCFVFVTSGARAVAQVLAGMVSGLSPYFVFVLTFALTAPHGGALGASLVGAAACSLCYLTMAWVASTTRRHADDGPELPEERSDAETAHCAPTAPVVSS